MNKGKFKLIKINQNEIIFKIKGGEYDFHI